jgi:hypothetical protein
MVSLIMINSQTLSLAIAIVALGMTIYLYRKTSIEIQTIKSRPSVVQMQPLRKNSLPIPIPEENFDEICDEEKSTEEVKDEA